MISPDLPVETYVFRNYIDPPARGLPRRSKKRHKPEQVPDWLQAEKIHKAQEKRDRKAKAKEETK